MQVHYTRLFTDKNGASRFENLTIELQQAFSVPGLETSIFSAPFLASEGSLWVGAPSTWNDERLHQAPRRMIQVRHKVSIKSRRATALFDAFR
jgi:hypothetical protein